MGHVQKRVCSRLRRLKISNKGVKLSDKKGPSGKGRLTDAKIDVLQNYYALANREKLTDVQEIAKVISLFYVASKDKNPQHHLCLKGDDLGTATKETAKHTNIDKAGIPDPIVKLVDPIFNDLAKPALLN